MSKGQVIFLAAVTVVGGNFLASKSGAFRSIWTR